MKKYFSILLLLFPLFSSAAVPALHGRINDYAHLLSAQKKRELENFLERNERQTSNQIVFFSVNSLGGETIESYSMAVAEAWKIGQKGKDNGVILLVAKDDRQMRIEVGRGLEPYLTDLNSGRIIRDIIAPSFKQGDFERGIAEGLKAIASTANGNTADVRLSQTQTVAKANSSKEKDQNAMIAGGIAGFLIIGVFSFVGIAMAGCLGYFFIAFMVPTVFGLSTLFFSARSSFFIMLGYLILVIILKALFGGKWKVSPKRGAKGLSRSRSGSSFRSSSGSSFSGGGGSFGGGGASGRW